VTCGGNHGHKDAKQIIFSSQNNSNLLILYPKITGASQRNKVLETQN
jgi:hypothetical protein